MTFARRLSCYALEALGLFGFVLVAGLVTIALEHPDLLSSYEWLRVRPTVRHLLLGIVVGGYTVAAVMAIRHRTGAHMNPAITFSFLLLGRMRCGDALAYTVAHFIGATAAAVGLKVFLYDWFSHPAVHFGATRPQPPHTSADAFLAEALISFITMAAILVTATSRRLDRFGPGILGGLLLLFLTFELPYSGMSMNPARSFGGDVAAGSWAHLWIYVVAPTGAMAVACALFPFWRAFAQRNSLMASDYKSLPVLPVDTSAAKGHDL